MQTEALPVRGLGFFMFNSNHLMGSDLFGEGGREGVGKIKIITPPNHKHFILVLCPS